MIDKLTTAAHLVAVNTGAPRLPASADVVYAAHNVLASPHVVAVAQAAQAGASGSIGATVVCMGAYAWYEVKHKGWDWIPLLFGVAFASILSGTALAPLVTGLGTGISGIFGALFTGLSSMV